MNKRIFLYLYFLAVLSAICVAGILFIKETAPTRIATYTPVYPFQLTASTGQTFNSQELQGKVWVVDFIFTTCGSICPLMTTHMAALQRSYALEKNVAFVSISVNPENDTPERLTAFAKKYNADLKRWHFLTGKREDITKIAVNTFKVGSIDEPIFHSSYFILVDQVGNIRGYYDGLEKSEIQRLFKDIASLLKKKAR